MAKHVVAVMSEKEFIEGTKLKKPTFSRLIKGDSHPLKVLQHKLRDYHALSRGKLAKRHELLTEIVADCVEYAGSKPEAKRASSKLQTVFRLETQASNVILLETERARQLSVEINAEIATAKAKGLKTLDGAAILENKFEMLNKAGTASIKGEDLVQLAKSTFGVELTGDDTNDFYAMKKVLKAMQVQKAKFVDELNLVYMDSLERDEYVFLFLDAEAKGIVVSLGGDKVTTKKDMWDTFIYAMDPEGYLYAASPKDKADEEKILHHSSFLAGKPAVCAGTIRVVNGRLLELSNESGHYRPGMDDLLKACEWILSTGYDPSGDGHVIYLDHAEKLKKRGPGQKSPDAFRIPIKEFVESAGMVKNPDDFLLLKEKKFLSSPDEYIHADAAKKRGCTGLNIK